MQITNSYILAAGSVFLVLTAVFVIGHAGRRLAERNASDIRIVWYFFSLSLTSTLLIAWWASSVGAIDATGSFHGTAGSVLHRLLDVMLDLETDLKVLFGLAALVIAPQLLGYLLSSPFGCSTAPILVGPTFRFVFWSVVKFFVVAAGIFLVIAWYGWAHGWSGLDGRKAAGLTLTGLLMLVLAFALLYLYRDLDKAAAPEGVRDIVRLRQHAIRFASWASRHTRRPVEVAISD